MDLHSPSLPVYVDWTHSHSGVSSATLRTTLDEHQTTVQSRLLVGIHRSFVLRRHRISFPPLPVVVAVVVDLLDRDRGLRWDVIREVVGALVDLVLF